MRPLPLSSHSFVFRALAVAAAIPLAFPAAGQTAPGPGPATAADKDSEAIMLDPFEVRTETDTSYGALNSNSITKFNISLDKTPITADIFTQTFMDDVDAIGIEAMFSTYAAGAGTQWATPSFGSITNQPGDRVNIAQLGVRGLGAGGVRRDGFGFTGNVAIPNTTSNFDIERVEVLRGPQGLLYGASGAGGTIVATTKQAKFNQKTGELAIRVDQYGSRRTLFDANVGKGWIAARVALLREVNKYRRLDAFDQLNGYYGQLAFRLPAHTTLRLNAQYNSFWATTGLAYAGVNLGGASIDPRSGQQPGYLLFTNQTGAINPATGAPYSKHGAIWNGKLDWYDYASYGQGLPKNRARTTNNIYEAQADTVWSKWLSTSLGFMFTRTVNLNVSGPSAITAPGISGNPFSGWAVSNAFSPTLTQTHYKGFRGTALLTKDFFGGIAKTQTALGSTIDNRGIGSTDYAYYASDSTGNLILSPGANNLGRTPMSAQWWSIDAGPGWNGNPALGSSLYYSNQDGKYYALVAKNPRDGGWITPNNPLGLASLYYPNTGISGNNLKDYANRTWIVGYYAGNFTSWWNDMFTTLVGFRTTQLNTHNPNTNASFARRYVDTSRKSHSYNLGVDGRITQWLRWYASLSSTFDVPWGQNDPYGNPPQPTKGTGREAGLKFSPLDGRISGSVGYFHAKDENQTLGSRVANTVNPSGLNGVYNGIAGKGSWDSLDYTSQGVELILTANPVRNWRIRVSATRTDGTIGTTKTYGILYNDQFYADKAGNVTYRDGSPVVVPVSTNAISSLNKATDPATILATAGTNQTLTTAMIGDPASPYYAWQGGSVSTSGNIRGASNVGRVLQYFTKPGVGNPLTGETGLPISAIQYAWPNPANYPNGVVTSALAGESTQGYPMYRLSVTNSYEFDHGFLKGLGVVLSLNNAWQWRTYTYASPDGVRRMYSQPQIGWQANLNPFYQHRFRKVTWRTQLNVSNLFNHYVLAMAPNDGLGFTNPNNITVAWYGQPRVVSWTNTFKF